MSNRNLYKFYKGEQKNPFKDVEKLLQDVSVGKSNIPKQELNLRLFPYVMWGYEQSFSLNKVKTEKAFIDYIYALFSEQIPTDWGITYDLCKALYFDKY